MVKMLCRKLVSDGKVVRGYLGVVITEWKDSKLFIKEKKGAVVLDISNDTPAAKYGFKKRGLDLLYKWKSYKDESILDKKYYLTFKPNEKS